MARISYSLPAVVCSTLLFAACSGGGGGGGGTPATAPPGAGATTPPAGSPTATPVSGRPTPTPAPTVTPTPTPKPTYVLPSANAATLSTYSIDSSPENLTVMVDGSPAGTTPTTANPAYATSAHTFSVIPQVTSGTPNPYTVTFAQTADGPHAIFYNQKIDTAGKIASISMTALDRGRARRSLAHAANGPRRFAISVTGRPAYDAHRLVVRYDPSRMTASLDAVERAHGAARASTYSQSSREIVRIVTLASGVEVDAARAGFQHDANVASVDRVRLRYPLASATGPVYPNDPYFTGSDSEQWYLDVIDIVDAWGYGLGTAAVPIAVIDTGYDPNQPEVAPGVTFYETIVGGTLDTSASSIVDTDGHGTYVSGIAAAQTNNGAGFAGVSYGASLQEYKVFTDGSSPTADSSDVAEAIRLAVANGAKIIVAALGGTPDTGPDPLERDAVAYALANGVTVVAGSGDDGDAALDYPAAYDGVISVGASAIDDTATPGTPYGAGDFEYVPQYSNSGPALTLVAPGGAPQSATDPDLIRWIANSYTTQPFPGDPACASGTAPAACSILDYGTTPAAAQVAGVAALMISDNASLAPAQIANILEESADDIADGNEGHGRLNALRAVAVASGDASPMPALPAPSAVQFVAFAYDNSGAVRPHMLDSTYPLGVPVSPSGTFRIADIATASLGTYKIAVWADVNGDGLVDAGDYFGAVAATCSATAACSGATTIKAGLVPAGYTLP